MDTGSIEFQDEDGNHVQEFLQPYDEEEKQENQRNKNNAALIWKQRFLSVDLKMLKVGLTPLQALVYSFITQFFADGESHKFYFTNEQLASTFQIEPSGATRILKILEGLDLINIKHKTGAKGGLVRWVEPVEPGKQSQRTTLEKVKLPNLRKSNYNNKLELTSCNSTNVEYDVTPISTLPEPEPSLTTPVPPPPPKHGNEEINRLLVWLKGKIGIEAFADKRQWERRYASHLINLINKIGKQEFVTRFDAIVGDEFKRRNCNKIEYIYRQTLAFVSEKPKPSAKIHLLNPIANGDANQQS